MNDISTGAPEEAPDEDAGASAEDAKAREQGIQAAALTFDGLLDQYTPTEDVYEFVLPKGQVVKAKSVTDASRVVALNNKADTLLKAIKKAPHEDWKPYLPASPEIVRMAVYISTLMIEPPFTFTGALKTAKQAGGLFMFLSKEITGHIANDVADDENAQLTDEGEG